MKKFSFPKAPRRPTGTVFRNGAMASVLTAAVLAVVILLNLLVNSLPTRYTKLDLSQTGIYTIGETTEQVLAGVGETVNLYYLAQTGQGECFCRFDVAEVYPASEGEPTINYITNAF